MIYFHSFSTAFNTSLSSLLTTSTSIVASTTIATATTAREFFKELFIAPQKNLLAIGFFALPPLAAIAGIIFLLKMAHEKISKKIDPPE